jgi:hypothetical protein
MTPAQHASMAGARSDAGSRSRSAAPSPVHPDDACTVLADLKAEDSAGRLASRVTGEWMFVFKPRVAGTLVYVKLILRDDCVVVSFHEEEGDREEEDS